MLTDEDIEVLIAAIEPQCRRTREGEQYGYYMGLRDRLKRMLWPRPDNTPHIIDGEEQIWR